MSFIILTSICVFGTSNVPSKILQLQVNLHSPDPELKFWNKIATKEHKNEMLAHETLISQAIRCGNQKQDKICFFC